MIVRLNGRFVEDGPHLATNDRGFLIGDGVFETIYVEAGRPAFLAMHLARLRVGLETLQIPYEPRQEEIADAALSLARMNGTLGAASLRLTVSRGAGLRGLGFDAGSDVQPTETLALAPLSFQKCECSYIIGRWRRFSRGAACRFKAAGGYLDNMLSFNEARSVGADEAIMLNEHGRVVSATSANVFLIDDRGRIATPNLEEGAMPGIVRTAIINASEEHGFPVEERPIDQPELDWTRQFLTNSLIGVRPVVRSPVGPPCEDVLAGLRAWYADYLRRDLTTEQVS